MTKKYNFERKFNLILSVCTFIFFVAMIAFFATKSEFAIGGISLLIFVVLVLGFVSFFPYIVSVTGFLQLKDGVLSRTYFLIKIWSVKVSEITDIYTGNTSGDSYANQMGVGLTFRIEIGEKHHWKQVPYRILNEGELILDLTTINSNIKLHNDPEELRIVFGLPT